MKLAGLYSLVATCEANGVNSLSHIEDVLTSISTGTCRVTVIDGDAVQGDGAVATASF